MARNALQGSIAAYNGAVAGGNVTLLPSYPRFVCPAVCFNANGLAFISVGATCTGRGLGGGTG